MPLVMICLIVITGAYNLNEVWSMYADRWLLMFFCATHSSWWIWRAFTSHVPQVCTVLREIKKNPQDPSDPKIFVQKDVTKVKIRAGLESFVLAVFLLLNYSFKALWYDILLFVNGENYLHLYFKFWCKTYVEKKDMYSKMKRQKEVSVNINIKYVWSINFFNKYFNL